MPTQSTASPDDIEMTSVFSALKKGLPKILIWSAVTGAATFGVLGLIAPKYQSQAALQIVAPGPSSAIADSKTQAASPESLSVKMDKEAVNTHVIAMQSRDLLSKVAGQLKLVEKREFNSAKGAVDILDQLSRLAGVGGPRAGESEADRVLSALNKQLEIFSPKETRSINIRVTSIDPELAANIANNLAESYRQSLASTAAKEVDEQQSVLKAKIEKLTPEVAADETKVEHFRGEINVFKGGAQNTGLNEQQLSELTAELTKAKAARSEVEARAKAARELMKAGSADALPDVQKSPLIQNLVQQRVRIERQISELSATLLPGHPRMQQLNADLAGLKKQLSGEVSKLVDSLEKEVKVALGKEDALKKSLDEIKAKVVTTAPEEAKLRSLEANAKAKRAELENLQSQLEANRKRLDARAQPVEAQIVTKAVAESLPISPKKGQAASLVGFATLLLGTFLTIARALFTGARGGSAAARTMEFDDEARAEPVLEAKAAKSEKLAAARDTGKLAQPKSGANAGPKEIAAQLRRAAPETGGHRALVTGADDDTGGGEEAVALATALSDAGGQTVLLHWSHSGGSLSGLQTPSIGLADLVSGDAGFDDVIKRMPGGRVHYIGCGSKPRRLADAEPEHINLVLDALDEAYDHIVVTGPQADVRQLFEAIQGRFDAGILVGDAKSAAVDKGTFLGFEVTGIDILAMRKLAAKSTAEASVPAAKSSSKISFKAALKGSAASKSKSADEADTASIPSVPSDRLSRAVRKGAA